MNELNKKFLFTSRMSMTFNLCYCLHAVHYLLLHLRFFCSFFSSHLYGAVIVVLLHFFLLVFFNSIRSTNVIFSPCFLFGVRAICFVFTVCRFFLLLSILSWSKCLMHFMRVISRLCLCGFEWVFVYRKKCQLLGIP